MRGVHHHRIIGKEPVARGAERRRHNLRFGTLGHRNRRGIHQRIPADARKAHVKRHRKFSRLPVHMRRVLPRVPRRTIAEVPRVGVRPGRLVDRDHGQRRAARQRREVEVRDRPQVGHELLGRIAAAKGAVDGDERNQVAVGAGVENVRLEFAGAAAVAIVPAERIGIEGGIGHVGEDRVGTFSLYIQGKICHRRRAHPDQGGVRIEAESCRVDPHLHQVFALVEVDMLRRIGAAEPGAIAKVPLPAGRRVGLGQAEADR